MDIVVDLQKETIGKLFDTLEMLGYRPAVAVSKETFSDEERRKQWAEEKGMKVLNFWSDLHPGTPIDIFVQMPFDFEKEYQKTSVQPLSEGLSVRVVSYATLLQMKKEAGRPKDLADIDELKLCHEEESSYD